MATSAGTAYVRIVGDLSNLNKQLVANFHPTRFGKFGKAAGLGLGAGIATGFAGKGLFDIGKQFDDAFDTIRVGTGKTGKSLDGLKEDFKDIGKDTPSSFGEIGTAVTELNQRLGLTGEPLQNLAKQMLNLSRLTRTDLSTNIESVARAFEDWEVPVSKQSKALDGLFRLGHRSGASVAQLATNVQKFGSPLRILGFTLGEAAATFATFERAGVNIQTTVPGLKLAISNLTKPSADLGKSMEQLGISVTSPERGLKRVFALLGKSSDLSNIEKRSLAMEVFGKRAVADMAEAIRQGRFEVDDMLRTFGKGDTLDEAARQTDDFNESWQRLKKRVFIGIQPVATEFFTAISDGMAALATADFGKIGADLSETFELGAVDLSGVKKSIQGSLDAIDSIIHSWLAKLAASFTLGTLKKQVAGIAQIFRGMANVISGTLKLIDDLVHLRIGQAFGDMAQIVKGGVQASVGALRLFTAPVREISARVGRALAAPFRSAWRDVKEVFSSGARGALRSLRGMVGDAGDIGRKVGSALVVGLRARVNLIRGVASDIVGIIQRIPGRLGDIGGAILDAFKRGLSGKTIIPKIDPPGPGSFPGIKVPNFAAGGTAKRTSLALVGEEGPELAELPVGTRVHSHPVSKRMAKDMGIPGFAKGGEVGASRVPEYRKRFYEMARGAWPKVSSYFGRAAGMPVIHFSKAGAYTYRDTPGFSSGVWIPRGDAKAAVERSGIFPSYGLGTLVHEWAHVHQAKRKTEGARLSEGGAEAFARHVAPRVFSNYGKHITEYPGYVSSVIRDKGLSWVLGEQFEGMRASGKAARRRARAPDPDESRPDEKRRARATGGLQPAARYLASTMRQKFGLSVSPQGGVRPGDTGSFHAIGKAVDLVGRRMREGAEWVKDSGLYKTLLEGIHNPNLSTDSGKLVSPGFWGGQTWAGHRDHIHLAASTIKQTVKAKLDEKGGAEKKRTTLRGKILSLGQMVTLAKRVGFPDPALAAAVGYAESRGKVGVAGDGGDSLGLWQINTPAHPRYNKDKLQHDAFYNARAALAISKQGRSWRPWTQFRTGAYKRFLGGKATPLPKGTGSSPPASKYADYLALWIDQAGDTKTLKDDRRWINKALHYWRRVYRRNKAGNPVRALDARSNIKSLNEQKKALRPEDPNIYRLGDLTKIGKEPHAFNLAFMQRTLDQIDLEKARAGLTIPKDTDDSQGALAASLQDDIGAASKAVGIWDGLYQLTTGIEWPPDSGKRIVGTVKQQIEAATSLKSARDELKSLKDESGRSDTTTPETPDNSKLLDLLRQQLEATQKDLAISRAQTPIFERFKKLPSFDKGGVVPGPIGQPTPVIAHGGEVIGQAGPPGAPADVAQTITVIVEDGAVDPNKIRVVVNDEITQQIRKGKSGPTIGQRAVFPR